MELHCTLHTSMNPPLSFTYTYSRNRSRGFLEMVGHVVIGVRLSSMNANNLSSHTRRSGLSSISYNLLRLSVFYNLEQTNVQHHQTLHVHQENNDKTLATHAPHVHHAFPDVIFIQSTILNILYIHKHI